MHMPLSTGLSKEKVLAVHLLAIYKSSSSYQLSFYLSLKVLSVFFLTNTPHPFNPTPASGFIDQILAE